MATKKTVATTESKKTEPVATEKKTATQTVTHTKPAAKVAT